MYGLFTFLQDLKEMFERFDRDGNGSISFDEFLEKLRVSGVSCPQCSLSLNVLCNIVPWCTNHWSGLDWPKIP